VFKDGLLVLDLERAMLDLGRWLGLAWTPVQESPLALVTVGRSRGREAALRVLAGGLRRTSS
jgi:hypothetical protein